MKRLRRNDTFHRTEAAMELFREKQLSDRGAALTYFGILSLFPGVALLVSILGIFGTQETVDGLLSVVSELGPSNAVDTLRDPVQQIAGGRDGAGIAALLTLAGTLFAASGYLGAFERSANLVRGLKDERKAYVQRPLQLGITLGMVLLAALILSVLLLTGPLAGAVGRALGLGDLTITIWSLAKWPALLVATVGGILLLFWSAGGVHAGRSLRELLPGAVFATTLWLLASVGLSVYLAFFGSYDATYGSLGAVIVFFVWSYITNLALLLGLAFNES